MDLILVTKYLPWLMSAITIVAIDLQGRKWPQAWALSLAGQVPWFIWIASNWELNQGFLPMTVILSIQYVRNHLRWRREARVGRDEDRLPRLERPCARCSQLTRCMSAGRCTSADFALSIESTGSRYNKFPPPPSGWTAFIRRGR